MTRKPILCLDFDGVLHHYTSKWTHANEIHDGPTPGAQQALEEYLEHFSVQVFSSRTHQPGGLVAMQTWALHHLGNHIAFALGWPQVKPPALVTLDDRALTFTGEWPTLQTLKEFRPWNKPR